MILNDVSPSPLAPNSKMSYSDMTVGLPMLINCLLIVPFSIFFHYAYDVNPYHLSSLKYRDEELQPINDAPGRSSYHGGTFGMNAWAWVCDPRELVSGILFSFKMLSASREMDISQSL